MTSVVVDASIAIKWVVECGNALWRVARSNRITPEGLRAALDFFAGVRIEIHPSRSLLHRALDIARELDNAAYDCFYLALAEREAIACVTADRRFADKVRGSEWETMIDLMHFP